MPSWPTVRPWILEKPDFSTKYARAREARADARSDRIDAIVERVSNGTLDANSARVMIDAEKWQAGRENPKRYGDKMHNDHSGTIASHFTVITGMPGE